MSTEAASTVNEFIEEVVNRIETNDFRISQIETPQGLSKGFSFLPTGNFVVKFIPADYKYVLPLSILL
jgi:hypothetical protein